MGRQPLRRDEPELPGLPQIAEGVMAGHHLALAGRQAADTGIGLLQKRV